MKRYYWLIIALFLFSGTAFAQSTTVSGSIIDASSQSWFGGTFSFVFKVSPSNPTGPYFWNGVPFSTAQTITGPLDGSAHYSVSIPSNTSITPSGSTWTATFCPLATSPCFVFDNVTITGASQTVAPIPPAIAIGLISPPGGPVRAYSDSEISTAAIGSIYYNLVSVGYRNCTAVSGQVCTTWQAISGGASSGINWYTVATLPGSPALNTTAGVTDGNGASCTVGGGTTNVICRWTGSVWLPVASNLPAGCAPGGALNDLQKNNGPGACTGSNVNDNGTTVVTKSDTQIQGPNPSVDIRSFGAVAVNTSATPYLPGVTANCSASTSLPISAASSFVNGQGVAVQNCGATNTMSTPAAPTVTSSGAAAPIGSGYTVPGAAGGSEQTCYVIVAIDKGFGTTLPSSEVCVTGQARGQTSFNLSSCQRTAVYPGTLVTCTTTATHTMAVGEWIQVKGTNLDLEYAGWHIITAVTSNTFSYQWNRSQVAGASTVASSGGTVTYWQLNHLALGTPGTNVWQYAIYRGASGAETFVDVSMIVTPGINLDSSYMTWDDAGTTYTTATNRPWFLPNTPPVAATNDTFTTTIASGAGSTTLVLAAAPTQTVSGTTIVTDATPNYIAALNFASANHGMVYVPNVSGFPLTYFGTNTILDLNSYNGTPLSLSQAAWFGATLVGNSPTVRGDVLPSFLTTTQFSIEGLTNVTFSGAKPGVYARGGRWDGLAFNPNGTNTQAMFLWGNIPTGSLNHDAFLGAGASGDFASIPLIIFTQGQAGSTAAGIKIENILTKGTVQGISPLIMTKNFGEVTFNGVMAGGRGFFFSDCPTCGISGINFNQQFEIQQPTMPVFVTRGTIGLNASAIIDTGAVPLISHVGGGPLTVCAAGGFATNVPQITGFNITSVTCSQATDSQRGVNTSYFGLLPPQFIYDGVYNGVQPELQVSVPTVLGPNYSLFSANNSSPAAPTCSVVTAGPPFSMSNFGAGTYTFAYTAVYPNGGQSLPSGTVSCTMDAATQQATVTIPAAISGAVSYDLLFGFTPGALGNYYTITQPGLSILVPSCAATCQGQSSPTIPGGGPMGIRGDIVWAPKFIAGNNVHLTPTASAPASGPGADFFVLNTQNWPAFQANNSPTEYFVPGLPSAATITPTHCVNWATTTTLGDSGAPCFIGTFSTVSVPNISQNGLNNIASTTNAVGLTVTPTNTTTNQVRYEITGNSYTGNAATATNIQGNGSGLQCWSMNGAGTVQLWAACGSGTPASPLHSVQFNNAGAFGGTTVPAVNGQYGCGYTVIASAAVDPTCPQVGLGGRAITGATNSDTVVFGDNVTTIDLDDASTAVVSQTLPTATTLTNPAFVYNVVNHNQSNKWLAVNPTTWTVQNGVESPASTQTVFPGWSCRFKVDPNSASQWLSDCYADPTTTTLPHTIAVNQGNGQRQTGIGTGITGQQLSAVFGADPILVNQGTPGRLVTGTADAVLCDTITQQLDRASTIQYTNAAAIAVSIPQAGGNGCGSNFVSRPFLTGAGGVTVTPQAYPAWTASVVYPTGYFIKPVVGNNAGGFTFQNQTGAPCTSGTATPGTFNQTPLGTTLDNTGSPVSPCTWTNVNVIPLSTINGFTSWKLDPNVWCSISSPDNLNWLAMCASYVPGTVIQTGTTAVGANACTTPTTVTMNGVIVGSSTQRGTTFNASAQSNTNTLTGWGATGGLVLNIWASAANQMSWSVCNQTGSSINPGGPVNWSTSAQ